MKSNFSKEKKDKKKITQKIHIKKLLSLYLNKIINDNIS